MVRLVVPSVSRKTPVTTPLGMAAATVHWIHLRWPGKTPEARVYALVPEMLRSVVC